MKLKLFLIAALFLSVSAFSQTKNNLSVYWATVSDFMDSHSAIGDFGYDGNGGTKFGINYELGFSRHWSIQTGLQYTDDKLTLNTIGPFHTTRADEIKFVTVPIVAKVTFWNVLFFDGGILADFETSNNSTNHQSGIGYEIGAGLQYHFGRLQLYVNPYAQYHRVFGFSKSGSNFNLIDGGWKFGLGYNF